MKVIAFLNNKGGVGKTATMTAVSHIFSEVFGKRVLNVDMDPQGNTSQLYGFSGMEGNCSLKELIEEKIYPVSDTVEDLLLDSEKDIRECIYKTDYDNLDIIPSYLTLSEVENRLLGDVTRPQQFRLKGQLEKIKAEYDFCFIDCGPSVSLLNVNALTAADIVYIPSRCDKDSRVGIANVIRLIRAVQGYHPELRLGGVFLTQYDDRKKICREAREDCMGALGEKFLEIPIPTNTKVEQAASRQTPLYALDPYSKAAQSYLELGEYILKHS